MTLHVLPTRAAGAPENMATDFLLLQRYPDTAAPRFRHYEWHRPAFPFGYAQKIASVRSQLPPDENLDLCRRPTGGGIVDHREDWTYALVIPRGHPLEELRASHSYKAVHEALATALRAQGVAAVTKTAAPEPDDEAAGVCFQRAEIYDVVHEQTGEKIAGAAQKRNKHGLLFQGSIWRPATGVPSLDWEAFHAGFAAQLASVLSSEATTVPWPDLNDDELSALSDQYSSGEWIEFR
jgi:lipoyl(octanoyl) transferase